MKQLTCLTTIFCAYLALTLTAFGGPEPLPSGKEMKQVAPAPEIECTWTGFYVGGNGGYDWGNADTRFEGIPPANFTALEPTTLTNVDPSGFIGGGQLGFNWQFNKWLVLGIETDFQGTDIEGDQKQSPIFNKAGVSDGPDTFLFAHQRIQWFGSTRGRIGISPWYRWLFYGTGGVAYGNIDYAADTDFLHGGGAVYTTKFSTTNVGWTAGGGIEFALSCHWSVRAEYLHYDLGSEDRTSPQLIDDVPSGSIFFVHNHFETSGNIVRGGFNFKF
jgi:outer membrane immunogenic protein